MVSHGMIVKCFRFIVTTKIRKKQYFGMCPAQNEKNKAYREIKTERMVVSGQQSVIRVLS